ncbi:MAG: DoxX family protein [Bacteroidales bacterium]|nr:DoxX family protein [Bacteroidales bacterium]
MINKTTRILSSLAGIVFLISGIGKSLAAYDFSQILIQYGFEGLQFLAPLIIVFEILAGLLLFFHIRLRLTSLLSFCFVVALSAAYLYGYFFANITNCGCFGYFSLLNMSPFFTGVRNIVLMGMLLYVFLKSNNGCKLADRDEMLIMACILCAVSFVTGYTYMERQNDTTQYVTEGKLVNMRVENSVLGEFLTPSKDSTYLVFAFSYSCPHCYNSIENLKQYERLGVVDKVLALSFATDSTTMAKFNEIFHPDFQIINYSPKQIFRLTNQFPVSYYIKDNMIKMEIRGVLPCGYLLRQRLGKNR